MSIHLVPVHGLSTEVMPWAKVIAGRMPFVKGWFFCPIYARGGKAEGCHHLSPAERRMEMKGAINTLKHQISVILCFSGLFNSRQEYTYLPVKCIITPASVISNFLFMKTLFNYFLRGLIFVFPLAATLFIILTAIRWSNETFNDLLFEWLNVDIPGLGIITVFLGVALIGYLFSKAFTRPLIHYFERFLQRVPLVKIVYTSIKELTEAFVGDKKRFNKPVIVELGNPGVKRVGFVTRASLEELGLEDTVAVYCPHSYNFSGNLYFVPEHSVTPVDSNAADIMKFIISGGVTRIK